MNFPVLQVSVPIPLDLNFVNGTYTELGTPVALSSVLSISRASTAYAETSSGTLTSFGNDTFRITNRGLLIENARTNVLLRSQELDNSGVWTSSNVTVTADATSAPDGTTTAEQLAATAANSTLGQALTGLSNGASYVFSIYMRAASPTTLSLFETVGATNTSCNVTTSWQRFTHSFTQSGTTNTMQIGGGSTFSTSETIFAWGAQLEQATFASSYIPTTTASTTRARDQIDTTGTLNSMINTLPNSFVVDIFHNAVPDGPWKYIHQTDSNRVTLGVGNFQTATTFDASNFTNATLPGGNTWTTLLGQNVKTGLAQASGDIAVVTYGGTVNTSAFSQTYALSGIGGTAGSTDTMYGYFRRLSAWDSRLTNTDLQDRTAP